MPEGAGPPGGAAPRPDDGSSIATAGPADVLRPDSSGVAKRRWLLIAALLVAPISMRGTEALFLLYLVVVAVVTPWRTLPLRRLLYLVAAVAIATLWLASGTTGDAGWHHPLALQHRHPVSLFDYLLMLFGFAVMAIDRYSIRDVRAVLSALVATVPVHFIFAIGQRYLDWGVFWSAVPIGHGRLLELNLRIPEILAGRTTAGLVHPNRLGAYSLICLVAAATLLIDERRARPSAGARWPCRLRCAALAAIVVACLLMLMWSGSRGAWLSAIVLAFPVAWLIGIHWRYVAGAIAGAGVVVWCAAGQFGVLTRLARRVVPVVVWGRLSSSPPAGLRVSAPDWRLRVYRCTWDLAGERPLAGWGVGGWVDECEARLELVMNHAHNIFLQVAVESGWVAAILFAVALTWVLGASVRQVALLPEAATRRHHAALLLMAVAVLLTNQTALVLMQTARLEIVFALAVAIPYSLVFHRALPK